MLGTLRLLLALAVAASHANARVMGLNPGVVAVIGFYLISGYVMAGLLRRHYPAPHMAGGFYRDRALRLLPQYTLYATLTLVWQQSIGIHHYFLSHSPTATDLINNALIVPLNYYMFNSADRYTLIPPAWSLGAEIQFYILAPILLLWPRRIVLTAALALAVYLAALAGWLQSDWYGYRLLPGVLLFFMLGAGLNHLHHGNKLQQARSLTALVVVLALLALLALQHHGLLRQPYNLETLLGLTLGMPALHLLARLPRKPWDELAGDLSYGVFLNHFLLLWVLFPQGIANRTQLLALLGTSIVMAYASQRLAERPLLRLRTRCYTSPPPAH